jgi:phosphatidylserine/phosphatidylglycerophosphate/cardiolipin synthase-like enzyme
MAKTLSRFAKLPPPADMNNPNEAPTGAAIFIVLSSREHHGENAYGDHAEKKDLKGRVIETMKYMASKSQLPVKTRVEDVEKIVNERLLLKRVRRGEKNQQMHAKLVCVDRNVLYVGSDNQYPHYNEEFGCWLEHPDYVGAFFKDFYDTLWKTGNTMVE